MSSRYWIIARVQSGNGLNYMEHFDVVGFTRSSTEAGEIVSAELPHVFFYSVEQKRVDDIQLRITYDANFELESIKLCSGKFRGGWKKLEQPLKVRYMTFTHYNSELQQYAWAERLRVLPINFSRYRSIPGASEMVERGYEYLLGKYVC
jgi:hypothetical protein